MPADLIFWAVAVSAPLVIRLLMPLDREGEE
jgi:hypothetical protein